MSQELNRPTPEGIRAGIELARLTDADEVESRKRFPKMRERCASCAYRRSTIPNGCEETVMDALKASLQGDPFYCHMDMPADGVPQDLCAGWMITQAAGTEPVEAPWPYSHDLTVCAIEEAPEP